MRVHNQQVNGQTNYKRCAPIFHREDHKMHMLIVALDYRHTGRPLNCVTHARNIEELARQCGVQVLVPMYDEQCTKEAVLNAIKVMGSKCGPDDFFLFYFAGHGASGVGDALPGEPGHDPRADEAVVLVDKSGRVSSESIVLGDDLSDAILKSVQGETRILLMQDCSHPAAVLDLSRRPGWSGRQATLIAGLQHVSDNEDPSKHGLFTHAILLAVDKLSKVGRDNYSVGMLHNATLFENELVFSGKQDFVIQTAPNFSTDAMAWPLVPPVGYQAPLSRAAGPAGIRADCQMVGVTPAMLQHVKQENLNIPVSIEEYVSHVQGQSLFQLKPCRACTAAGCTGTGGCAVQ